MITIKTQDDIRVMAEGGRRLAKILELLRREVQPGMETAVFDARARELCKEMGGKPAFLGYTPGGSSKGFPAALCVSVNDVVVHGIPGNYVLKDGDVVKLDMGLLYRGWYLDSAVTVCAGSCASETGRLLHATEQALHEGIKMARPGKTTGDIGWAIGSYIAKEGFSVVEGLTGHGIGKELHEDPNVFNIGRRGQGEVLREGMVIAIEPMVAMGGSAVAHRRDGSFAAKDGSLTAHFEHTVAITKKGPKVLTSS